MNFQIWPPTPLTKPTKPGYVGFVSTHPPRIQKNRGVL